MHFSKVIHGLSVVMKKLYVETSIISYHTARPNRDLVIAARQEITRDAWPVLESQFELYISALVIQEAGRGDEQAVQKRLDAISDIPVIEISQGAMRLAGELIAKGAIPKDCEEDALHIALACFGGMDFLLTWNFKHINNAIMKSSIVRAIEEHGFTAPEICSPEELIGE